MKLAGIGFPNGPADDSLYLTMPGPILMLDSEARWHIDRYRAAGKSVVWRSMATPPARLGWSPSRYVDAVLRHVGEQRTSLDGGLIFANEWNLSGERGDGEDDWSDNERRYTFLNAQIIAVAQMLRQRVNCPLWYPAWSPHQHWRENVDRWAPSVDACDVLAFHEYETLGGIHDTYHWLRSRWPDKPLALTEWNCRQSGTPEIRRVLEWLATVEQSDPLFVGAYYFIGRWHPPADSWTPEMDVEGNPDRLSLFLHPPGAVVEPPPVPEPPMYRVPTWTPAYEHIRDGAIEVADQAGLPRRRLLGLCLAESGFGLQSFDRWASTERSQRMKAAIDAHDWTLVETTFAEIAGTATNDISFGAAHQSWWWSLTREEQQAHPEWRHDLTRIMDFRAHLIEDHGAALRLAAGKIRDRSDTTDDLEILCFYNKPDGSASAGVRANYQRSLVEADRILAALGDVIDGGDTGVTFEDYRDPEPAGRFPSMPKGVILHGSRSGAAGNPKQKEYEGTARYEQSNTAGLGWHATLGMGKVALHLQASEWGWHALQASKVYLGVEFAQATVDEPIEDAQVDAFCAWFKKHVLPVWPNIPLHFPSHAEADVEFHQQQGKSDVFPLNDPRMDDLRARIMKGLTVTVPDPGQPDYSVGPGILAAMSASGDRPASAELYFKDADGKDQYSEAFGASGSRYVYVVSQNRTFRYPPAA